MMGDQCAACPHPEHSQRVCGAAWDERNQCECTEWRPGYILAIRAQALDEVQELIELNSDALPTPEVWQQIITAAFPPPPMA